MRMLNIKEVAEKFGVPKASAYRIYKNDESFPKPIRLSTRTVRWLEEDVDAWVVAKRDSVKVSNEAI